ncbi:MAG TPA: amidase [Pseudonocardiaceae bacterium]|jgi:amidase|nr:amidase [Pseudonocardiaceae bacterium]
MESADFLSNAGLAKLSALLADGAVTATELTTEALRRAEASQPTVNAFRRIRTEGAIADAADADRRLTAGECRALLGIPIAVKDDMDVTGVPTAYGCPGEFPTATEDSEIIGRLRAAGAIIVGKTNLPELGQWPFTEGSAFGVTRNPWHLEHTPGGSSGGSAAAVAAGIVPAAIGSDGAGSVRIPAAWTHLVGIKPQTRDFSLPVSGDNGGTSVCGPLARTVADAALVADVLADRRPDDENSLHTAAGREPKPLRIGLSLRTPFTGYRPTLNPEVHSGLKRIADSLVALGHQIVSAEPRYGLIGLNFLPRSTAGLSESSTRIPDPALLDPFTRRNIRDGDRWGRPLRGFGRASTGWYERLVGRVFQTVDVLLTPTTAVPPPRVGAWKALSYQKLAKTNMTGCPYAWAWNVLGWPAINVPAGLTGDGVPVGVQLLGPADSERTLISLAAQLERRERWPERRPPAFAG